MYVSKVLGTAYSIPKQRYCSEVIQSLSLKTKHHSHWSDTQKHSFIF